MPFNPPIQTRSITENQLAPHILLKGGDSSSSQNSPNYVDFNATAASVIVAGGLVCLTPEGRVTPADGVKAAGIALTAGEANETVTVRALGLYEDIDFNFTPGAELFLGPAATITETAPDLSIMGAFLQSIGTAITPTVIFIYLGDFFTR